MKEKILWLLVSCLMVSSLMTMSCGTTSKETTIEEQDEGDQNQVVINETEVRSEETKEPTEEKSVVESPGAPKYGGSYTIAVLADPTSFDDCEQGNSGAQAAVYCYQQPMNLDWTRGPAGSGITDFNSGGGAVEDYMGPEIAEGWTMPEPGVWVLQIRQGVQWQDVDSEAGQLVRGRELTADDVVYSFNRHLEAPKSWLNISQPVVAGSATIEKTGPWEVTIRTPVEYWTSFLWVVYGAGSNRIYAHEVVEKYGNVEDWRNTVGTGPFIFADYVPSSAVSLVKNPNYWETDPVGPGKGNQLPYVDVVKEMIIPDLSTQQAGLRTGKIDMLAGLIREHWAMMTKQQPELEYIRTLSNLPWVIGMRTNDPELPYYDVKVRQALMLATDFQTIVDDYYQGEAEIDVFPVNKTIVGLYKPISELSDTIQELYTYNPEKAKQLLAEAGYPDGFKANVICSSDAARIDDMSIFQDMWSKVNVNLDIEVVEPSGYIAMAFRRTQEEMIYRYIFSTLSIQLFQSAWRGTSSFNSSFVNDPAGSVPLLEDSYNDIQTYIFSDTPRAYEAYKSAKSYLLEQAFYIPRPTPYTYTVWWPWLQNFYGQLNFSKYYWVDTEMKKTMG